MWVHLVESSGSEIFQELLLGLAIQHTISQEKLTEITQEEIDFERNVLLRTLQNNTASNLELLLAERGYGETRLHALCQRNAGLRKLVQQNTQPLLLCLDCINYFPWMRGKNDETTSGTQIKQKIAFKSGCDCFRTTYLSSRYVGSFS